MVELAANRIAADPSLDITFCIRGNFLYDLPPEYIFILSILPISLIEFV